MLSAVFFEEVSTVQCPITPARRPSQHQRPCQPLVSCTGNGIGFRKPHVGRWLNAWNELENCIADSDEGNDATSSVLPPVVAHDDAPNEDVDCPVSVLSNARLFLYVQTPRPTNENMNEAYLAT